MTKSDARIEALTAVFDDRDRSVEGAVDRGIDAGIALERERVRSILELPTPRGLEKSVAIMIINGLSVDVVAELYALYAEPPVPVSAAEIRARRAAFRVIEPE